MQMKGGCFLSINASGLYDLLPCGSIHVIKFFFLILIDKILEMDSLNQ